MIAAEVKTQIVSDYKTHDKDTGSPEVQIAILTKRINDLRAHFDSSQEGPQQSRRGLLKLVSRRNQLLKYLTRQDPARYKTDHRATGPAEVTDLPRGARTVRAPRSFDDPLVGRPLAPDRPCTSDSTGHRCTHPRTSLKPEDGNARWIPSRFTSSGFTRLVSGSVHLWTLTFDPRVSPGVHLDTHPCRRFPSSGRSAAARCRSRPAPWPSWPTGRSRSSTARPSCSAPSSGPTPARGSTSSRCRSTTASAAPPPASSPAGSSSARPGPPPRRSSPPG